MKIENTNLLTGFYMNYCSLNEQEDIDLFVIFNEGNGIPDDKLIAQVDDIMRAYIKSHCEINKDEVRDMLDEVVEFGVQIFGH